MKVISTPVRGLLQASIILPITITATAKANWNIAIADGSVLPQANNDCLKAFNRNVTCDPTISDLFDNPWISLDKTTLDGLCTSECRESLTAHRDAISSTCKDVVYEDPADGSQRIPTFLDEWALMAYDIACLKKSGGQYCNLWYNDGANKADKPQCDECYLKLPYIEASSPAAEDPQEAKSIYESMSSSCSYKGPSVTKTVSNLVIASPTGSWDCDANYTIKVGDTALDVSKSQKVSTHDLLTSNGLNHSVEDFPTSGFLCIRNRCETYTVKDGDNCKSIQSETKLNFAELRAWNPDINGRCSNILAKINTTICRTNPFGDYAVPNNSGGETAVPAPGNLAPGTNTNCSLYHEIEQNEDCSRLQIRYSISLKDLIFLNPMIWENCTNLWFDTSYCVAPVGSIRDYPGYLPPPVSYDFEPERNEQIPFQDPLEKYEEHKKKVPIAKGTRPDCWTYAWWNDTESNYAPSVSTAAWLYDLSVELFMSWNLGLENDGNVKPSSSYCVGLAKAEPTLWLPPTPRAPGETEDCSAWFPAVTDCKTHLRSLRLSLDTFFKWNPSVGQDCSVFANGTYYCYRTNAGEPGSGGENPTRTSTIRPMSTTTTKQPGPSETTKVSPDGTCSGKDGYTCLGSLFGDCCSSSMFCGSSKDYCAAGCQAKFGKCNEGSDKISPDGTCGGSKKWTCKDSLFGDCCSGSNFCGATAEYCGSGCQKDFGSCR